MKKHVLHCLLFCLLLTGLPLIPALAASGKTDAAQEDSLPVLVEFTMPSTEEAASTEETLPSAETTAPTEAPESPEALTLRTEYRVLDMATGEVLSVPVREYVIGAVCAEMPASFEPEALKAQAVAAHTYAERQVLIAGAQSDGMLKGADFSNDPAKYQAFCTEEEIRSLYGERYEEYYTKVEAAVDTVLPEILVYEEQPIIAAFHAMSGGMTESAENVWGSEVAYLQPVDSSTDVQAPMFEQSVTFGSEEVRTRLEAAHSGMTLPDNAEGWFGKPVVSEAGTVLQVTIGNSIFTGQEIRQIFSLRSAIFQVEYSEGAFTFTTKGYGHTVGMSQYGANAMAKEGADYREILMHYYPGAEIVE